MKKLGVLLVVTLMIGGLVGCAGSGGKSNDNPVRYSVDLSTLTAVSLGAGDVIGAPTGQTVRNATPFTKNYDDLMILLPEFPASLDWSEFSRVTIKADVFDANGDLIAPGNGNAMVSIIYDPAGDIRGPGSEGPSKNIPLKTFNLGGSSSSIARDRGYPVRFTEVPRAVLLQNSSAAVKFIEVTDIVFHNGSASGPAATTFAGSSQSPFDLVLNDNFEYGNTWMAQFRPASLLNNYAVRPGDVFELTVTYTASRDLSNPVLFGFYNIGSSWTGLSKEAETPVSTAGEVVSQTLTINISGEGGADAEGNTLVIQSIGTKSEGPVTLSFTEFTLKKN